MLGTIMFSGVWPSTSLVSDGSGVPFPMLVTFVIFISIFIFCLLIYATVIDFNSLKLPGKLVLFSLANGFYLRKS